MSDITNVGGTPPSTGPSDDGGGVSKGAIASSALLQIITQGANTCTATTGCVGSFQDTIESVEQDLSTIGTFLKDIGAQANDGNLGITTSGGYVNNAFKDGSFDQDLNNFIQAVGNLFLGNPDDGTCSQYTITYNGSTYYPVSNGEGGYSWELGSNGEPPAGYDPNANMDDMGVFEYQITNITMNRREQPSGAQITVKKSPNPQNLDEYTYTRISDKLLTPITQLYNALNTNYSPTDSSSIMHMCNTIYSSYLSTGEWPDWQSYPNCLDSEAMWAIMYQIDYIAKNYADNGSKSTLQGMGNDITSSISMLQKIDNLIEAQHM